MREADSVRAMSRKNDRYAIAQFIKQRSKGVLDFREGTLYPALHNLENKGLLDSYEEPENGRIRRYYRLTESGISALNAEVEEWKSISGAIGAILNAKRATA